MIEWAELIDEGHEGYFINNRGEVLSTKFGRERILKTHINKVTGYRQITIQTETGKRPTMYIHRLVAKYFCENPNDYNRVHHKDHNKTNNHHWNLEWCTQEHNIYEYYNSDERNKPRNMKPVEVWTIGGDYIGTYPSCNKAAKEVGVAASTVWQQVKKGGEHPRAQTYIFKYEEDKLDI